MIGNQGRPGRGLYGKKLGAKAGFPGMGVGKVAHEPFAEIPLRQVHSAGSKSRPGQARTQAPGQYGATFPIASNSDVGTSWKSPRLT
jgi:hypothetical protein